MRCAPARAMTAAIALVLSWGCAVAPSPLPPSSSPAATGSPIGAGSPVVGGPEPVLIGWERHADTTDLLVVLGGDVVGRRALPAEPNGPIAASSGSDGSGPFVFFLSGSPEGTVLWTSTRSLAEPTWHAQTLSPPAPLAEPLAWACAAPGSPPRIAVQSGDNLVYLVDEDGGLRLLPPGRLMLRPGGCAWLERNHLIVPADDPRTGQIAFAVFAADAENSALMAGTGGEAPNVSGGVLAFVGRGDANPPGVWIGPVPRVGQPMPDPEIRVRPQAGKLDLFRPVLSAHGRRLAVAELARPSRPARLLVYELGAPSRVVLAVDVSGAVDAAPAWVADPP